jgi:hypothetical protein
MSDNKSEKQLVQSSLKETRESDRFLDELAKRVTKKVTQGIFQETKAKRKASDNAKAVIVSVNNSFKSAAIKTAASLAKKQNEDAAKDTAFGATTDELIMRIINRETLIVLADNAPDRVAAIAANFRTVCTKALKLVGSRNDPAYESLLNLGKDWGISAGLLSAYKNGEDTGDKLVIVDDFLVPNTTNKMLEDYAIEHVRQMVEEWEAPEDTNSIADEDRFLGIAAKSIFDTTDMSPLNPKVMFIFEYEAVDGDTQYSKYAVVEVKVNIKRGAFEDSEVGASTKGDTGLATFATVRSTIVPPLLAKEAENTRAGKGILEWGHLISLATRQIKDILDKIVEIDSKLKPSQKADSGYTLFHNLMVTIESIYKVSSKVDSIFEDWSGEGLTGKDIYFLLANSKIDINKINYIYKASPLEVAGGKDRLSVTGTVEKKISIQAEYDIGIEPGGDIDGTVEGGFERARFNRIKGHIVRKLQEIIKKIHEKGLTEALTEADILSMAFTMGDSDSFAAATMKNAFGLPIDKGSGKTRKVTKKGINITTPKAKTSSVKSRTPADVKPAKGKKRTETTPRTVPVGKAKVPKAGKLDLINLINSELSGEVKSMMKPPRLQNRSGRFANSAEVTKANSRSIMYKYMDNPYQIFDKNRGKAPWNTITSRDPGDLISLSIRNILSRHNSKFANTVSIGKQQ